MYGMITKGCALRKVLTDVLQEEGCLRCVPAPELGLGFSSKLHPHLHHYWHVSLYPASIFSFEWTRSKVDHGFAI